MPKAIRNGRAIHYELTGLSSREPLVLLRGIGRTSKHWQRVQEELHDRFRLVLIDHRGAGRSDPLDRFYSTEDMALDVVAVLTSAELSRAHVFGVSLGGMVAQWVALRFPRRIKRLVLGSSSPGGPRAKRPAFHILAKAFASRLVSTPTACRMEAELLLSSDFLARHPEVVDHWIDLAKRYPLHPMTITYQVRAAFRHNAFNALPRIAAQTLILTSDVDKVVPVHNARLLAQQIPRAELAFVRGSGHDFATEQPVNTARILTEFLLR